MPETRNDQMKREAGVFHTGHPLVWRLFVRFTFELIARGCQHGGVSNVWERIRWETIEAQTGKSEFKLNNNHRAFYGRRFMNRYPQYAPSGPDENDGFFRIREQKSKLSPAVNQSPLTPEDFE
jgi:hypothetical protein